MDKKELIEIYKKFPYDYEDVEYVHNKLADRHKNSKVMEEIFTNLSSRAIPVQYFVEFYQCYIK